MERGEKMKKKVPTATAFSNERWQQKIIKSTKTLPT